MKESAFNVKHQDVPAPAVLDGGLRVPEALAVVLNEVQQPHIMAPRQFCNKLLQNWLLRPSLRKSLHIPEVTRRKAPHIRELRAEILRQSFDHSRPPTVFLLAR